jgi:hypothetical protein
MAAKNKVLIEVDAKDSTAPTLRNLNNNLKKTAEHGKKVDKQFRMIRGGMGQMGHQVQDVAVMLQSGQNPLIILGQQGSQVASLFGPQGAIIGAFLAVGAAIGTSMLPAFFKASKAVKELEEEGENLVSRFDDLGGILKAEAIRQNAEEMDNLREVISDAEAEIHKLGTAQRAAALGAHVQQETIDKANEKIRDQQVQIAIANDAISKRIKLTDDTSDATEKLIESLTSEVLALGKTETEQVRLTEAYKGATEQNKELINAAREKIDAHEAEVEAIKAEQKALDKAAKDDARRKAQLEKAEAADKKRTESQLDGLKTSLMTKSELIQDAYNKEAEIIQLAQEHELISAQEHAAMMGEIDQKRIKSQEQLALSTKSSLIGMTSSIVSTMRGMVDEGSAMGKAFFVISQALAASDAIIKGYQTASAIRLAYAELAALTANPGLAATGDARAAMAVGLGFATAGMIAGQTLASFEGGGLTGSGVRSGGVDGKGGFAAILHPNETVIDHTKGQLSGVVINQTINVTTGIQSTVRAEVMNLLPAISKASQNGVAEARLRGGQYARALG